MSERRFLESRRISTVAWLRVVLLLLCLSATPETARADLTWLKTANSCEMFAKGLASFVAGLGKMETLEQNQRDELVIVLREACGERLRGCRFEICRSANDGATGSEPPPDGSAFPVSTAPDAAPTNPAVSDPTFHPSPRPVPETPLVIKPGAIVTDPLAWLLQSLSCEQLVEQIQVRYSILGKFSELPVDKKAELRNVLDVSCSDRFAHCHFKSCAKAEVPATPEKGKGKKGSQKQSASANATPTPNPTAAVDAASSDIRAKAQLEFKRIYGEWLARRKMMIELALQSEKKRKLDWERMSNPDEVQELEARKAAAEEDRKRIDDDHLDSEKITDFLEAPFKRNEKARDLKQGAGTGSNKAAATPAPTPRPVKKSRSTSDRNEGNAPLQHNGGSSKMPPVMAF